MRVRLLDSNFLVNGNLTDDILNLLDVDLNSPEVAELDRTGVRNVSPGWRVLEAFRALYNKTHGLLNPHPVLDAIAENGRDKLLGRIAVRVGQEMGWNDDKGLYLTRYQAEQCLILYRRMSKNLILNFRSSSLSLLSLADRNFKERTFLPGVEHLSHLELHEFYSTLLLRWMESKRRLRR